MTETLDSASDPLRRIAWLMWLLASDFTHAPVRLAIGFALLATLATSSRDEDIARSYQLGCNAYVVKPESASTFIDVIHAVSNYWLGVDLLSSD